jgi:hypothetical protein
MAEVKFILEKNGWHIGKKNIIKNILNTSHASVFTNDKGFQIDLHRQFTWCAYHRKTNDYFRLQTEVVSWQGIPVKIFKPEAMLLHVCTHGARIGEYPFWGNNVQPRTLQWIIDCDRILKNTGPDFDWNKFIEHSVVLHAHLQARDALAYLKSEIGLEIPKFVFEKMDTLPVAWIDKMHYYLTMQWENPRRFRFFIHVWYAILVRIWKYL